MQINKNNIHGEAYQGVPESNAEVRRDGDLDLLSFPLRQGLQHQRVKAASEQSKIEPTEASSDDQSDRPKLPLERNCG